MFFYKRKQQISCMFNDRIKKRILGDNVLRIVKYKNDRIAVVDDWTGLEIQVNSFGAKNLEVFSLLFDN